MLLELRDNLIAVFLNLSALICINYPISRGFTYKIRMTAYPFYGLHKALVDIGVIQIINICQRYKYALRIARNGISDMG